MEPGLMQIGDVAERTGLTQRTIRFYEEKGILAAPTRMEGGFRLYTPADVEHIRRLSILRQVLCLSLEEIKALVDAEAVLAGGQNKGGAELVQQAVEVMRTQTAQIEEKYAHLKSLRTQWRQRMTEYEAKFGAQKPAPKARAVR